MAEEGEAIGNAGASVRGSCCCSTQGCPPCESEAQWEVKQILFYLFFWSKVLFPLWQALDMSFQRTTSIPTQSALLCLCQSPVCVCERVFIAFTRQPDAGISYEQV